MSQRLAAVTLITALGSGLVAGVLFAFSSFVMAGLARLPAAQGVAAMQAINLAAPNRWFMAALFGTAAACLGLAVSSLAAWNDPGARLRLAGALLYLAGLGITAACNIPRNDALAALAPDSLEAATLWPRYLAEWTAWNHARTAASLAAMAMLVMAYARTGRPVLSGNGNDIAAPRSAATAHPVTAGLID